MTTMLPNPFRPSPTGRIHPKITAKRVMLAVKRSWEGTSNPGFCISCGSAQSTDADAQGDTCRRCKGNSVYGAELLLCCVSLMD